MTQSQPASEFRYWAFISYSHTDKSWGSWLHKALETYRLPKRLIGMPTASGKIPSRLTPIFRDRDELPTASDLGSAIEEALRQSWSLVVICSPESAKSRWVNEEILAFQRLGRGDRIHCLIVDSGNDVAAPLVLPPALGRCTPTAEGRTGEPIAADARRFGDGRSGAKLKLIAGILGIGYDTLVQREHQRRHRNLFAVTCAALALVVVLSIATVIAITSRRDAVDQRGHAEGLVEFMIGDLRKKLEPDGKLATLDAVGKEALAYYASQKSADLDAEGLARRARALHMIGEVYDLRGDLDEALKVFEQAADSTKELLERDPDNGQRIFDHAQSVYWVGIIAYQRGNSGTAEPALQEYKRLAERLVAIDPNNEDWQAELGYANSNLGTLLFDQGRLEEAASIFAHELEMAEALDRRNPEDYQRKLRTAQAHAWLADIRSSQGQLQDAIRQREIEISIYTNELVKHPNDKDARDAQSVATLALARIAIYRGDLDVAVKQLQMALGLALSLHELDRENTQWTNTAAAVYAQLSDAFVLSGNLKAAREASSKATEFAAQLRGRDPTVVAWQNRWAASMLAEANLEAADGNTRKATTLAHATLEYLEKLPTSPNPGWAQTRYLVRGLLLIADLEREANPRLAKQAWERTLVVTNDPKGSSGPELNAARAIALIATGHTEEAKPIMQMLQRIGYQERSYTNHLREYADEREHANSTKP